MNFYSLLSFIIIYHDSYHYRIVKIQLVFYFYHLVITFSFLKTLRTITFVIHGNIDTVRINVLCSKCTEYGGIRLSSLVVGGFCSPSLQSEVATSCLNKWVFSQTIEGVLKVVKGVNVGVAKEPRWNNGNTSTSERENMWPNPSKSGTRPFSDNNNFKWYNMQQSSSRIIDW